MNLRIQRNCQCSEATGSQTSFSPKLMTKKFEIQNTE